MKKATRATKVWRGLTAVMVVLLCVSLSVQAIAVANTNYLNAQLGTTNYIMVEKGEGDSGDGIYFDSEFENLEDLVKALDEHAEKIAEEGVVLFKNNNNALPLNKTSEKVTLWGMNSHTPTLGGMIGSSTGIGSETGQIAYGIEEAMQEKGFNLNKDMMALYASDAAMAYARRGFGQTGHGLSPAFGTIYANPAKYPIGEIPSSLYTDALLASADGTAAVVVISRDSSEAADYNPNMTNSTQGDSYERPLALSQYERDMIANAKKHSTKVIVLINAVNPIEIEELKTDNEIDAILWVGAPGLNGFKGVADVLSGDVNPSGHIADTYATNSTSSPAMVNFGVYMYNGYSKDEKNTPVLTTANKADWYLVESEGIYIGYKYYETRYEDSILGQGNANAGAGATAGSAWEYAKEVSYPFGYGMSYTTFDMTLKSVDVNIGGEGKAVVTVKNTGSVPGKATAQLYVQSPYTAGGLEKSAIQLLAFAKTDILEPNASVDVTITFDPRYMASYDEDAVKANGTKGAWVLDSGDWYFAVGNGAHEALNNVLAKKTGKTDNLVKITPDEVIKAENAIKWTLNRRDIETYSKNVENALQEADLNNYIENKVEYTTRADWTKGWKPVLDVTPTQEMMVGLTNSNYALNKNGNGVTWGASNGLKVIDFMLVDENGNYAGVLDFEDEKWDKLMDQITLDEAIAFIEKGGNDIENIDSIMLPRTYENDGPLGFTYDQVGGYYIRWTEDLSEQPTYVAEDNKYAKWSMNVMPTATLVAGTFNVELIEREGELLGEEALWANESGILGPGTNLHRVPYCARNHEYYSEDSMLVAYMTDAVCRGGESKGLMMEPKHLAFNHQEANRSGVSTFFNEQAGRENELRCFQMALSNNTASGVMTAFNRIGTVFAGAHSGVQLQILREEWGYMGWIVTDMINGADYMNWRDTTAGGGGNCLTETAYGNAEIGTMADSKDAIAEDTHFQEMMKYNIKFWIYQMIGSNAMNGLTSSTEIVYVTTWWQNALTACVAVTAILSVACAAAYVVANVKANKKEN